MLIDLLSTSNYVSFNIKLAEILGLKAAVYLAEVMNINEKAIRKKACKGEYFKIDRRYIQKRTTLTSKEQADIDTMLINIGILEPSPEDTGLLCLKTNALTTIIMSTDEKLIGELKDVARPKVKATKADMVVFNLKSAIETTNPELRAVYEEWIDAVMAKLGWMSKTSVIEGQRLVDEASGRNLDIALQIVGIASVNGYKDMEWAVKKYKAKCPSYGVPEMPIPTNRGVALSEEVF